MKKCPECGDKMPVKAPYEICTRCMESAMHLMQPNTNVAVALPEPAPAPTAKASLAFSIMPADPMELAAHYGPNFPAFWGIKMEFGDSVVVCSWGRN